MVKLSKRERMDRAEQLYNEGLAQAAIAAQLGVSHTQIRTDLACVIRKRQRPHSARRAVLLSVANELTVWGEQALTDEMQNAYLRAAEYVRSQAALSFSDDWLCW
jgi:hypothetical protein